MSSARADDTICARHDLCSCLHVSPFADEKRGAQHQVVQARGTACDACPAALEDPQTFQCRAITRREVNRGVDASDEVNWCILAASFSMKSVDSFSPRAASVPLPIWFDFKYRKVVPSPVNLWRVLGDALSLNKIPRESAQAGRTKRRPKQLTVASHRFERSRAKIEGSLRQVRRNESANPHGLHEIGWTREPSAPFRS